jgi:thioredoxin reductase (NADPH)
VLFDSGMGRSTYHQINHNYLGFPGGISARELRELGRKQLRSYPVVMIDQAVLDVRHEEDGRFTVMTETGAEFGGRTIILATGVRDHFPHFPDWEQYVGRSLFWCINCDGYKTRGRRILVLGNDDDAAITALQFLQFTRDVLFLTNAPDCRLSEETQHALEQNEIPLYEGEIEHVVGADGIIGRVVLKGGDTLEIDFVFSMQGVTPNNDLAKKLGIRLDDSGFILTDTELHTHVAGALAAGDVTRLFAHQVATAVHEGLSAASSANYFLYAPYQQHETYEGKVSQGSSPSLRFSSM